MKREVSVNVVMAIMMGTGGAQEVVMEIEGDGIDRFLGQVVVVLDDLNGDGRSEILAGFPDATVAGEIYAGKAAVFSGLDGSVVYSYEGTGFVHQLGISMDAIDDLDGDDVGDFLISIPGGPNSTGKGRVRAYSGATGEALYAAVGEASGDYLGNRIAVLGDVSEDGLSDFVASVADGVRAFSGADGSQLFEIPLVLPFYFVADVEALGDVNLDGIPDFVVANSGAEEVTVHSGLDGSLLYAVTEPAVNGDAFSMHPTALGDFNGDGVQEFSTLTPSIGQNILGVFSGADGTLIREHANAFSSGAVGDLTGDGTGDYMAEVIMQEGGESIRVLRYFSGRTGLVFDSLHRENSLEELNVYGIQLYNDITGDGLREVLVGLPFASVDGLALAGKIQIVDSGALGFYHSPNTVKFGQNATFVIREGNPAEFAAVVLSGFEDDSFFLPVTPLIPFNDSGTVLLAFTPGVALIGRSIELTALATSQGELRVSSPDDFVVE